MTFVGHHVSTPDCAINLLIGRHQLTSQNLPLPSGPNRKSRARRPQLNGHAATENKKSRLPFTAIFPFLDAAGGRFEESRGEEGEFGGTGKAELGIFGFAQFDCGGGRGGFFG